MDIRIEVCQKEDLNQVLRLQNKWVEEDITIGLAKADLAYLKAYLNDYFLLAKDQDEIVAYTFGSLEKAKNMAIYEDGTYYFEIEDLYVSEAYRSHHIGSQLMNGLKAVLKANDIHHLTLYSSTKDIDRVKKFYESHGFKTWHITMYQ